MYIMSELGQIAMELQYPKIGALDGTLDLLHLTVHQTLVLNLSLGNI